MPARLISLDSHVPQSDTTLVGFPILIGSAADAQIRLDDQSISPHHCEIDHTRGTLFVRDLDSLHGTYVNGSRIRESRLHAGDELAIGVLTFRVQDYPDKEQAISNAESRDESQQRPEKAVVLATA